MVSHRARVGPELGMCCVPVPSQGHAYSRAPPQCQETLVKEPLIALLVAVFKAKFAVFRRALCRSTACSSTALEQAPTLPLCAGAGLWPACHPCAGAGPWPACHPCAGAGPWPACQPCAGAAQLCFTLCCTATAHCAPLKRTIKILEF